MRTVDACCKQCFSPRHQSPGHPPRPWLQSHAAVALQRRRETQTRAPLRRRHQLPRTSSRRRNHPPCPGKWFPSGSKCNHSCSTLSLPRMGSSPTSLCSAPSCGMCARVRVSWRSVSAPAHVTPTRARDPLATQMDTTARRPHHCIICICTCARAAPCTQRPNHMCTFDVLHERQTHFCLQHELAGEHAVLLYRSGSPPHVPHPSGGEAMVATRERTSAMISCVCQSWTFQV
jgi:hypothetical protein